jgi:hypothetical protein
MICEKRPRQPHFTCKEIGFGSYTCVNLADIPFGFLTGHSAASPNDVRGRASAILGLCPKAAHAINMECSPTLGRLSMHQEGQGSLGAQSQGDTQTLCAIGVPEMGNSGRGGNRRLPGRSETSPGPCYGLNCVLLKVQTFKS